MRWYGLNFSAVFKKLEFFLEFFFGMPYGMYGAGLIGDAKRPHIVLSDPYERLKKIV